VPSDVKTTMSTHWLQLVLDKPLFYLSTWSRRSCWMLRRCGAIMTQLDGVACVMWHMRSSMSCSQTIFPRYDLAFHFWQWQV